MGCVDMLESEGIPCFGPDKKAAIIEGSKAFSKELMKKYGIPTAEYEVFDTQEAAFEYLKTCKIPVVMEAVAVEQDDAFAAGLLFARTEGIVPAPESTHAVAGALARARDARDGEVIVIGLSGNGVLDLPAYEAYL